MNGNDTRARRLQLAFAIFAAIAGVLLLMEHRAHVLPYLPWLLLAACPLMHVFMYHGRHGGHERHPSQRVDHGGGDHE